MISTPESVLQNPWIVQQDEDGIYVVRKKGGIITYCFTMAGAIRLAKRRNRRLEKERAFSPPKILWEPK